MNISSSVTFQFTIYTVKLVNIKVFMMHDIFNTLQYGLQQKPHRKVWQRERESVSNSLNWGSLHLSSLHSHEELALTIALTNDGFKVTASSLIE